MNTQINIEIQRLLIQKGIDMPINTTIADVVMWLYKKHNLWVYSHKDGGWWFPVIENYYDEDNQGTIIEDLSKMSRCCFNSPIEAYESGIKHCLTKLI